MSPAGPQNNNLPVQYGASLSISRNLSVGMKGDDVRSLQSFLVSQGSLAADSATGYFGLLTQEAVRAFQRANGIVSSGTSDTTGYGLVGPRTLAVMRGSFLPKAKSILSFLATSSPKAQADAIDALPDPQAKGYSPACSLHASRSQNDSVILAWKGANLVSIHSPDIPGFNDETRSVKRGAYTFAERDGEATYTIIGNGYSGSSVTCRTSISPLVHFDVAGFSVPIVTIQAEPTASSSGVLISGTAPLGRLRVTLTNASSGAATYEGEAIASAPTCVGCTAPVWHLSAPLSFGDYLISVFGKNEVLLATSTLHFRSK